jgi:hypothetical protein
MNEVLLLAPVHARTSIKNMGYEYGKSSLKIWNLSKDSLKAYLSKDSDEDTMWKQIRFRMSSRHLPNTLKEIWKK